MEILQSDERAEINRTLEVLPQYHDTIWHLEVTLPGQQPINPRSLFRRSDYASLLGAIYNSDTPKEILHVMRADEEPFGLNSDPRLWQELCRQARFAFNEGFPAVVSPHYLPGIKDMTTPGKVLGAALALENVFSGLAYPEINTPDHAVEALQKVLDLKDETMQDIIRFTAIPMGGETLRQSADGVFLAAIRHSEGITRRAVSDASGEIDFSYFGGPDIIAYNLQKTFSGAIRHNGESATRFQLIRDAFPEQAEAVIDDPVFEAVAHSKLRHEVVYFPGKIILPAVLQVIPREAAILITQQAQTDMEHYIQNAQPNSSGEIGDVRLLRELGFDAGTSPHYYPESTLRGIKKVLRHLQSTAQ